MNALIDSLRGAADESGVISFARFMELALYHPDCGYYEKTVQQIGREGDYYTSVNAGSLMGELLAAQFCAWAQGLPQTWRIVEAGAHDGRLAHDILSVLQPASSAELRPVEYWILEPSLRRENHQRRTLEAFAGRVHWFKSWAEVPTHRVTGVIFANELLDAFPVHRVGWDALQRRWFEWGVKTDKGALRWARMLGSETRANGLVAAQVGGSGILARELLAVLPDGFTTEVCPTAVTWWRQAAQALRQGRLMTLDYGHSAEEFFLPDKAHGSLQAYRHHQLIPDVLAQPGEQDLTAPVNFTALQQAGEEAGLNTEGQYSQEQFLVTILERGLAGPKTWTERQLRQFHTLTHPEHLGRALKVLVQRK